MTWTQRRCQRAEDARIARDRADVRHGEHGLPQNLADAVGRRIDRRRGRVFRGTGRLRMVPTLPRRDSHVRADDDVRAARAIRSPEIETTAFVAPSSPSRCVLPSVRSPCGDEFCRCLERDAEEITPAPDSVKIAVNHSACADYPTTTNSSTIQITMRAASSIRYGIADRGPRRRPARSEGGKSRDRVTPKKRTAPAALPATRAGGVQKSTVEVAVANPVPERPRAGPKRGRPARRPPRHRVREVPGSQPTASRGFRSRREDAPMPAANREHSALGRGSLPAG